MSELLQASMAFPSVGLTILVGIAFLYWIFVIFGALDLDLFHADSDVDGLGDGAVEAQGHDIASGADIDGTISDADAGTFLRPLGLRRVPLTISLTFILVIAWTFCLLGMYYLGPWVPDGTPRWLFGLGVLCASLIAALPLTALAITPIAPAFVVHVAKGRRDNVGATCIVTTGRVDHAFGQAKIIEGASELVIPVRCDGENSIARQDKALVIDYDDNRQAYLIAPLDEFFKKEQKES